MAGQGITTIYHSFSFANAVNGVRNDKTASEFISRIKALTARYSLIRNKIHLRFEITNFKALALIKNLIDAEVVDLLSFMNHTPGQGQYPTIESYRRYAEKTYNLQDSGDIEQIIKRRQMGQLKADECVEAISIIARQAELPLASHDDDTAEKIMYYCNKGVRLSEFPINLETAAAAKQNGMFVSVGAPNIVRGGSTGHGIRAIDAVSSRNADILCSDYYPAAMLHAVFSLAEQGLSLPEAVVMATYSPAKALNLHQLGSLEEGKIGDVIIVKKHDNIPVVTSTVVDGILVYDMNYRRRSDVDNLKNQVAKGG
ncbi:alpha-D-ribose 1-methylphosphonate 5-triphosphate diphosphatase [Pectinatus haikarae]|uniref:Alpha-D-ribose 1-methylphosphonate 5-triphosphate diphosphatase n=1 Tax=Pectinatus haikarae TaxID=349096 RepID=A0ABT9YC26_9FIRM|nr:alpha-D-ribose 1-methylphosphonate 5-triphosphate diphosphatase [Pectinatus haikarae]MDQ0204644.1 alpha-D-ribose 1-methylphosphonate 5-triphosphate diphosphatase [Pectinatus haikarae]